MLDRDKLTKELTVLSGLLGFNITCYKGYFDIEIGSGGDVEDYFYTIYKQENRLKLTTYFYNRPSSINRVSNSFDIILPLNYSNHKRILQHATLVLTERRKELNNESK